MQSRSLRLAGFLRLTGVFSPRCYSATPRLSQADATDSGRPSVPNATKMSHLIIKDTKPRFTAWELERKRVVPRLNTFYGGNPVHDDNMNMLNALIAKYENLPNTPPDNKAPRTYKFVSLEEYRRLAQSGKRLKIGHHRSLVEALNRLRNIDSQLMPQEVLDALARFTSSTAEASKSQQKKIQELDEFGRANVVGKRKRSVAEISLVRGEGQVLVNGESFLKYFPRDSDREKLAYPFKVVNQEAQYNVFITCRGGGISGQVEAAMHGIAKALVIFNPLLKPRLRQAGLITRDARKVERKKPGKVKARKSPTWVKR